MGEPVFLAWVTAFPVTISGSCYFMFKTMKGKTMVAWHLLIRTKDVSTYKVEECDVTMLFWLPKYFGFIKSDAETRMFQKRG